MSVGRNRKSEVQNESIYPRVELEMQNSGSRSITFLAQRASLSVEVPKSKKLSTFKLSDMDSFRRFVSPRFQMPRSAHSNVSAS